MAKFRPTSFQVRIEGSAPPLFVRGLVEEDGIAEKPRVAENVTPHGAVA